MRVTQPIDSDGWGSVKGTVARDMFRRMADPVGQ